MLFYLILALFLLAPLAALIWFIVSLVRFLRTPKGSVQRKLNRGPLVASGVTAGLLVVILWGLLILFTVGITYM